MIAHEAGKGSCPQSPVASDILICRDKEVHALAASVSFLARTLVLGIAASGWETEKHPCPEVCVSLDIREEALTVGALEEHATISIAL
jgi:hypothetical protein